MAPLPTLSRMLCLVRLRVEFSTYVTSRFTSFQCSHWYLEIWLQWWTRANEERPNEHIGYWLGGYGALGVLTLLATFLSSWCVDSLYFMIISTKKFPGSLK